MNTEITIITNEKNRIEQAAIDQLSGVRRLSGVERAVGLPDLHPGKSPIGIAVLSRGRFYPHLIGNDIGCGMSLFATQTKLRKYKPARWLDRLEKLQSLRDVPIELPDMTDCPISDLGTIGSGNHFAELQRVEQVLDEKLFAQLAIPKDELLLLVHSGSRGYGQQILSRYLDGNGLEEDSEPAHAYLAEHAKALFWAQRNRVLAAERLLCAVGAHKDAPLLVDCVHNFLEQTSDGWLHRKGATSAKSGAVVIPGSRGSLTYLCMPRGDTEISLHSLSHGAGRKWARECCKANIGGKYTKETIRATALGSRVVCHDSGLLFEEAPEAYKNISDIIASLQAFGLIDVIATLKPLLTWKG